MNNNPAYKRAMQLVNQYEQNYKPSCCCSGRVMSGPTGPTGPTAPMT